MLFRRSPASARFGSGIAVRGSDPEAGLVALKL